jgi:hypothetical protein
LELFKTLELACELSLAPKCILEHILSLNLQSALSTRDAGTVTGPGPKKSAVPGCSTGAASGSDLEVCFRHMKLLLVLSTC